MRRHPALVGMKTTIIGIITNAVLAIIKAVAGILGNSYALVADAIESTSDIFSSLIIWVGLKVASKPADDCHPYGHGKAEPMAAFAVSVALFLAAIIIIFQGIREIITPHHAPEPFTLAVLVVVVIVKEILYRFVFHVGDSIQSNSVKTDAWHHRSDAITSAFVFLGILIALIGGKGYESADDWAAILASFIIMYNAIRLARPALSELMDEAPPKNIEIEVRKVALSVDGVKAVDKCLVRKNGFDYLIDMHVVVDGNISVRKGHKISHDVKDALRLSNPRITIISIHIEPWKKKYAKGATVNGIL